MWASWTAAVGDDTAQRAQWKAAAAEGAAEAPLAPFEARARKMSSGTRFGRGGSERLWARATEEARAARVVGLDIFGWRVGRRGLVGREAGGTRGWWGGRLVEWGTGGVGDWWGA